MKLAVLFGIVTTANAVLSEALDCGDSSNTLPISVLDAGSNELVPFYRTEQQWRTARCPLITEDTNVDEAERFYCCIVIRDPAPVTYTTCGTCIGAGLVWTGVTCSESCPEKSTGKGCSVTADQCSENPTGGADVSGSCQRRCGQKGWGLPPTTGRRLLEDVEVVDTDTDSARSYYAMSPWGPQFFPSWGQPMPPPQYPPYGPPPQYPPYGPPPQFPPYGPNPYPTERACMQGDPTCACSCDATCAASDTCCYDYLSRCDLAA